MNKFINLIIKQLKADFSLNVLFIISLISLFIILTHLSLGFYVIEPFYTIIVSIFLGTQVYLFLLGSVYFLLGISKLFFSVFVLKKKKIPENLKRGVNFFIFSIWFWLMVFSVIF